MITCGNHKSEIPFSVGDQNYLFHTHQWCENVDLLGEERFVRHWISTTETPNSINQPDAHYIMSAPVSEFKSIPESYSFIIKDLIADHFPNLTCDTSLFSEDASIFTNKIR